MDRWIRTGGALKETMHLFAAAALGVLAAATPAGIHSWTTARQAAAAGHKPVLVELGAAWCAPCKLFAREVSNDDALRRALDAVVLWQADTETEVEGRALARKHGVQGLPTFLLLDGTGAVLDRWAGFTNSGEFRLQLEAALQDPLPVDERAARFEARPQAADALRLARIRNAEGNVAAALQYYTRARELEPEGGHEFEALRAAAGAFATGGAAPGELTAAADAFLARPEHPPAEWIACAEWMKMAAQRGKSPALAWPALRAAVAHATGVLDSTLAARRNLLLLDHALEIDKNPERALEYKRRTLAAGFESDARAVNSFAWWCLKHTVNLPEAERLARAAAQQAPPGRDRAMMLDTVAELRAARGDTRGAAEFAAQAAREAPENPYYAQQVTRFRTPEGAARVK